MSVSEHPNLAVIQSIRQWHRAVVQVYSHFGLEKKAVEHFDRLSKLSEILDTIDDHRVSFNECRCCKPICVLYSRSNLIVTGYELLSSLPAIISLTELIILFGYVT